jgi:DNA-binding response OmpR family regulator
VGLVIGAGGARAPPRLDRSIIERMRDGADVIRVLVVEDERPLAAALARWLRRQGMVVDVAHDGEVALTKARSVSYDVVVLDRHLPVVHGDEVCRRLVTDGGESRILMLTAASSTNELVDGLDLGADDYLAKPVVLAELGARLRALARRSAGPASTVLAHGDLELDPGARSVTRAERPLKLTRREFDLLEALLRADGRVLSTDLLRRRLWDERAEPFDNTVRVTVGRLRRKLGEPALIETVTGSGYRIP